VHHWQKSNNDIREYALEVHRKKEKEKKSLPQAFIPPTYSTPITPLKRSTWWRASDKQDLKRQARTATNDHLAFP